MISLVIDNYYYSTHNDLIVMRKRLDSIYLIQYIC